MIPITVTFLVATSLRLGEGDISKNLESILSFDHRFEDNLFPGTCIPCVIVETGIPVKAIS